MYLFQGMDVDADARNTYSCEETFSGTGEATPLAMRGVVAESLDENGTLVRLSSNTWMFRMVAITDELPRDLMFTVEEPTATADGYAARVVAHVTACDASVLSNACLVATVRDVSGAVVARVA